MYLSHESKAIETSAIKMNHIMPCVQRKGGIGQPFYRATSFHTHLAQKT